MHNGQKIRISGLGHASDVYQGVPGDLLLHIKVKDHPVFSRDGLNLISKVPITISEAVLGC